MTIAQAISLKTTKGSETFHILDQTSDFYLLVGPKQFEPHKEAQGYTIYNRKTGVIEAEGLSEAYARLGLKESQSLLDKIKSGEYEESTGLDFAGFDNGNPPPLN